MMPPAQNASIATRGYTLLVLTALSAMNQLDRQLMNILVEPIRQEFALSDVRIGLLVGFSFVAIYTVLSVPAAIYAVRSNRRNLLAASALLWGAMTVACGFAQSYWQLFVARFGVGFGEAGGMPPSHAMISDLYPPEERGTAMAIWAAGINGGVFFAFLFGGVVGHLYGWRMAFFGAGALTLLLAVVLRFTVREPARPVERTSPATATSLSLLMATLRSIGSDKVLRHVLCGATLASIVSYGSLAWLPSFLVRTHHMNIGTSGIFLALVIGIGGALGGWLGGVFSDRFRRRDIRWSLWLVAIVIAVTKPFNFGFLLSDSTIIAMACFIIPGVTGAVFIGPSLAVLHNRVEADLRPIASAVFLLTVNFIGLGVGPLLVGAMSQYGFAGFGADALRYSLVGAQFVVFWAALHYYLAGSGLRGPATPTRKSACDLSPHAGKAACAPTVAARP